MNKTRKQIYTQLFSEKEKVELGKVEVDLGIAQDIANLSQEAEAEFTRGENEKKGIKQLAGDAISSFKQARIKANQVVKAYEKFESSAKDLGLDIPARIKNIAEDAREVISQGEEEIKQLQNFR